MTNEEIKQGIINGKANFNVILTSGPQRQKFEMYIDELIMNKEFAHQRSVLKIVSRLIKKNEIEKLNICLKLK